MVDIEIDKNLTALDEDGNENMDTISVANWEFAVEKVIPVPQPPTTPTKGSDTGGKISETGTPLDEIDDVPLLEEEEEENITSINTDVIPLDEEPDAVLVVSPGLNLPQTGGIKTFVLPLSIALLLLEVLFTVTYIRRKDEKGRKSAE